MDKQEKKEVVKKPRIKKPKLVEKDFILIKDVSIGGKIRKKGKKVKLTEKGRKSFKKLNYI